ncbi:hypothetical protein GCM10011391_30400 [Pullulanibacillus camelliae]|uniref:Uncharacterized protein n=1 Tax=Pullulanibacillus camelliae TaxID=1707096 RepID=A0A8J2YKW0_9BACL|nr:hypothetical protein [Pullulanibacillus camelliae]GGE49531.1 hypothetical protein GCM10011391_30400 [Pullulanibacillus camelliae]
MSKRNQEDRSNKQDGRYDLGEDRMVNEGLAGGNVDTHYKHPVIDHSRPLKKDVKPKGNASAVHVKK